MSNERKLWLDAMLKMARPVLEHLANRTLRQAMPVEGKVDDRDQYTYLEALGRLLAGMAPWLETGPSSGEEGALRAEFTELARNAIDAGTDPASPDYMNFGSGHQPIVDTAFLAHAILRAPTELWEKLEPRVKRQVAAAFKLTRSRKPGFSNWLLFAAMTETVLCKMGEDWDPMRIDYALRQHEQWYLGDGMYGDGPEFHFDYYNSFVIQPMLLDIVEHMGGHDGYWGQLKPHIVARAARYATIQERLISPEGTYPPVGRSIAYRFGAFQLLAQAALQHLLEEALTPAQVRCALTAVITRTMAMPGMFDENGWLTIGLSGHQPELGEGYISTGSLYLCATVFLPLGLPPEDSFWLGEEAAWTSKQIWSGGPGTIDKAYKEARH
jgi:hypothetical protein